MVAVLGGEGVRVLGVVLTLLFTNLMSLTLLFWKNEQWVRLKNQQARHELERGRPGVFYV